MKQLEHCLEAYAERKIKKFGNYSLQLYGEIGAISMFGNIICVLIPDGGRLYSNCGYENSITTKKALGYLGCDYKKSQNIDLYPIIINLMKLWK